MFFFFFLCAAEGFTLGLLSFFLFLFMGTEARIPTLSGHPSSFNPLALISGLVFHKFIRTFRPFVSLSGRQAGSLGGPVR